MIKVLSGRVVSGEGNFSYWIERLTDYYHAKTGMILFPGTLNVHIDEPFDLPPDNIIRLEKEEYGGDVSVSIVPCSFMGRKSFILRTDPNDIGERKAVLEIASDIRLRDAFNLVDGDIVTIEVQD